MKRERDYYEILGTNSNCTPEELKKAYRAKAFIFHPDRLQKAPDYIKHQAEEELTVINQAYEILRDPRTRRDYDQGRFDATRSSHGEHTETATATGDETHTSDSKTSSPHSSAAAPASSGKFGFAVALVLTFAAILSISALTSRPNTQSTMVPNVAPTVHQGTTPTEEPPTPPVRTPSTVPNFAPTVPQGTTPIEEPPTPPAQTTPPVRTPSTVRSPAPTTTTFTIGSSQDDVKAVMGAPTSISGNTWNYEFSMVLFDSSGRVAGWHNISNNLRMSIGSRDPNASAFTLGSSKTEVISAMGTPSGISRDTWNYEFSMVLFDSSGRVAGWHNISNNLMVR